MVVRSGKTGNDGDRRLSSAGRPEWTGKKTGGRSPPKLQHFLPLGTGGIVSPPLAIQPFTLGDDAVRLVLQRPVVLPAGVLSYRVLAGQRDRAAVPGALPSEALARLQRDHHLVELVVVV